MLGYNIRWYEGKDLITILRIEQESFEYSWEKLDFQEILSKDNTYCMVYYINSKVVAYLIYEKFGQNVRISNLAVEDKYRKLNIATEMLDQLKFNKKGSITVVIRERNLPAQMLFKKNGFRAINIIKNYYEEIDEDAYLMEINL